MRTKQFRSFGLHEKAYYLLFVLIIFGSSSSIVVGQLDITEPGCGSSILQEKLAPVSSSSFSYSSTHADNPDPLPTLNSAKPWCAATLNTAAEYLIVDLGHVANISQLTTQGFDPYYVSMYYVEYSLDNITYAPIDEGSQIRQFFGPLPFFGSVNDPVTEDVLYGEPYYITARYIKFKPQETRTGERFCMRVDVAGCITVDGGFSNWTNWSDCSVTCGDGLSIRNRSCTNPSPARGGEDCIGELNEKKSCSQSDCPVDSRWLNITQSPQDMTLTETQTAFFQCKILAINVNTTIYWNKDGQQLSSDERIVIQGENFTILNTTKLDAGYYQCNAISMDYPILNDTSDLAELTVNFVDIIESPPPEQNVERNQNITLSCRANSNTNVTITWIFEDMVITEINGRISIVTKSFLSTLNIVNAQSSDEGFYACNATSPETGLSDVSTPSNVGVNFLDIINPPTDVDVQEGQNITISCTASSNGNLTIHWIRMFGDELVSDNDIRVIITTNSTSSTLTIVNAQVSDQGLYTCNATSLETGMSKVSPPGRVSLNYVHTVICLNNTIVNEGSNVTLRCTAETDPASMVIMTWAKNGKLWSISNVVNSEIESTSIRTIMSVNRSDAGAYRCIASNNQSGVSDECPEATLTVNFVDIIGPPGDQMVEGTQNITLSCKASSNTNVSIIWFNMDKLISKNDSRVSISRTGSVSTLTIVNVKSSDEGLYRCNATSPETGLSELSTAGRVIVNSFPSHPQNLKVLFVNQTSVHLGWSKPQHTGNRGDVYYFVSCFKCSDDAPCEPCDSKSVQFEPSDNLTGTRVLVSGLTPFSSYLFTVSALNGASSQQNKQFWKKANISVMTDESVPEAPYILTTSATKEEIFLSWSMDPSKIRCELCNYQVCYYADGTQCAEDGTREVKFPVSNYAIKSLEPDTKYKMKVRAKGCRTGFGPWSYEVTKQTLEQDLDMVTILVIILSFLALVIAILLGVVCCYFHLNRRTSSPHPTSPSLIPTMTTKRPEESIDQHELMQIPVNYEEVADLPRRSLSREKTCSGKEVAGEIKDKSAIYKNVTTARNYENFHTPTYDTIPVEVKTEHDAKFSQQGMASSSSGNETGPVEGGKYQHGIYQCLLKEQSMYEVPENVEHGHYQELTKLPAIYEKLTKLV